jgi:hypothetical protein
MAGGHGGLVFLGEVMVKPTNGFEEQFYVDIATSEIPPLPSNLGTNDAASAMLRGKLRTGFRWTNASSSHAVLRQYSPKYYGGYEENGTHIAIENMAANLDHPAILDVKIGASTCSQSEQVFCGKGAAKAWLKKHEMEIADAHLMSQTRGFRVVSATGCEEDRRKLARTSPEEVFATFFKGNAADRQTAAAKVAEMIANIPLNQYAMIAASVLIVVGNSQRPDSEGRVKVKLIDFAHAYTTDRMPANWDQAKFDKYSRNFSEGLAEFQKALASSL